MDVKFLIWLQDGGNTSASVCSSGQPAVHTGPHCLSGAGEKHHDGHARMGIFTAEGGGKT